MVNVQKEYVYVTQVFTELFANTKLYPALTTAHITKMTILMVNVTHTADNACAGQNSQEMTVPKKSSPFFYLRKAGSFTQSCPNDCSENGFCNPYQNICLCKEEYTGDDCS